MADIPTVIDGNVLDADVDWNPMATKVNDHETRILAIEGYESGTGTGSIASGANLGTGTITFTGTYSTTPLVFVVQDSVVGGVVGNFSARVTARSTTAATVTVFRTDGTTASSAQTVGFAYHVVPQ